MLRTIDEKQGIGIYTQNLMDHLLPLDKKNEYILFYRHARFVGRYVRYDHVREKLVRAPNKAIWDQVKIPLEAQREAVDVIFHTKFSVPLATRRKTVMVLHGSEWFVYPKWFKRFDRIYVRIMMRLYCKKASLIISNSDLTKRDFVNILRVNGEKIKTIYLGYDRRFKRIDDDMALKKVRETYRLPEKFILYVGRIHPGKNFGNLIRAFSRIHNYVPQRIVVAGHPRWGYEADYATIGEVGLREKILFKDWVPQEDLAAFYNLADVFVLPSLYEGFGIPVLEAMACGCPVVASNTGNLPEIARGAALLVNPRDPDEIAEAVRRVLTEDSLRIELGEKGILRARGFSWEKCARDTLAVFESLNEGEG